MSRGKKLIVLAVILAVFIIAAFAVSRMFAEEENAAEEDTSTEILAIASDDTSALSITYNSETLDFEKQDGEWKLTSDETFPVNQTYIENMLAELESLKSDRTIDSPESFKEYGLEEPAQSVSVTAGNTTEILFGDVSDISGEQFVSIGDGKVYMVSEDVGAAFQKGLYDLVQKEDIPDMSNVESFTVESDNGTLEIKNAGTDDDGNIIWTETVNGKEIVSEEDYASDETETSDTSTDSSSTSSSSTVNPGDALEDLMSNVTGLVWGECINYKATDDDLASYGLDNPTATVTVEYGSGTFVLEIGAVSDSYNYARIKDSSMVYYIDASVCEALIAAYDA